MTETKTATEALDTNNTSSTKGDPGVQSPTNCEADFTYEPGKISIKFLFANRDGLHVRVQCDLTDTVATVKGSLLSLWPEELDSCSEGGRIRLVCMGKGILQPDNITLEEFDVPVFKTHPTPVNVSVKPIITDYGDLTRKNSSLSYGGLAGRSNSQDDMGSNCCCVIS